MATSMRINGLCPTDVATISPVASSAGNRVRLNLAGERTALCWELTRYPAILAGVEPAPSMTRPSRRARAEGDVKTSKCLNNDRSTVIVQVRC